jgi:hypothetical protein
MPPWLGRLRNSPRQMNDGRRGANPLPCKGLGAGGVVGGGEVRAELLRATLRNRRSRGRRFAAGPRVRVAGNDVHSAIPICTPASTIIPRKYNNGATGRILGGIGPFSRRPAAYAPVSGDYLYPSQREGRGR